MFDPRLAPTHCAPNRPNVALCAPLLALLLAGLAPLPTAAADLPHVTSLLTWPDRDGALDRGQKVDSSGRYAVTVEDREGLGVEELWSLPIGEGAPIRLVSPDGPGSEIAAFKLSPDGGQVAFLTIQPSGSRALFSLPVEGGAPRAIAESGPSGPAIDRFGFSADSAALSWNVDDSALPAESENGRWNVVFLAMIFNDGFEPGDTSNWTDTTTGPCPAPTGGPTMHGNAVAANEVWTANGSPHIFTTNVQVPAGVTLTISPCAEVRIRPGFYLEVNGTLIARGTPFSRITVHRDNVSQAFQAIWVRSPGFADLAFLDIDGGGASTTNADLLVEGNDSSSAFPAKVDHVKLTGSAGYGLNLTRHAALAAGSRNLVISGAGATQATHPYPLHLFVNAVGTIPTGSYTGNATDLIQVEGGTIEQDVTFRDRGVAYQIGSSGGSAGVLQVAGQGSLATMTVEPNVALEFFSAGSNVGGLFIGSNAPNAGGRIVATGTGTAPIVMVASGIAPGAGSWEGVTFAGAVAAGNLLDHILIDGAGASGGDSLFGCPPIASAETRGALKLFTEPPSSFLTHSTISNSSLHGVFRAWIGGLIDFTSTNTFFNIAACNQVLPQTPPGTCPPNPGCG
ncbi:MAG: hypothetical protein ABI639_05385 [Thermoanaerobaculia bacterium]